MSTQYKQHAFEDTSLLSSNLTELTQDIAKVDIKLSDLDQLILDLKLNINHAKQLIKNSNQQDVVNLYKVINTSMDMLATYYQTYTKFMELKFRYRAEFNNMSFKTTHLIQVELMKIDKKTDANYYEMIEFLKKLSGFSSNDPNQSNSTPSGMSRDMQAEIESLDTDDIYSTK